MADLTKKIIYVILYWISQMQLISADDPYCEWGMCEANQFCCDYNECCPIFHRTPYIVLWAGMSAIAAIFIYFIYKHKYYFCRLFSADPEEKPIMA